MLTRKSSFLGGLKNLFLNYCISFLIISSPLNCQASDGGEWINSSHLVDSVFYIEKLVPFRIYHERISLSSSFTLAKNASAVHTSFFQFSENYSLGLRIKAGQSEYDISADSEIGYKYYLDSIWDQTEDQLAMSIFRFGSREKKFRYTYSMQLNSSILPVYKSDPSEFRAEKRLKTGGFFNPGELNLAYGFSWSFWDISFLNVSLASMKLQSFSDYLYNDSGPKVAGYKRVWKLDYGMSVNLRINHHLSKRLIWLNQSRFFFNSPDKHNLRLSINNQLEYKLISFLKLSAYTRVDYFPSIRQKIQVIQEFRLGFEWTLSQ